jgi:hypothetical protein
MKDDNHPFTGVYRGRVVSPTERQRVHGGGLVMSGWGGMRVDTETHNDFWIRSPECGDLFFKMGVHEPPPMLLDHVVTVVMAGERVCAVANHSTGFQRLYRPRGVYRINKGGWQFLLLALILLGVLEAKGYGALVVSLQIPVILAWTVWVGISGIAISRYNAELDKKLTELIHGGQPTERFANAREVSSPPRLP